MNNSTNVTGFINMLSDSNDEYEPYGYYDINDSLERYHAPVNSHKAGYNQIDYEIDE